LWFSKIPSDFKINEIRGDCVTLRYMDELTVGGVFEDHSRLYYSCRRSNSTGSMRTEFLVGRAGKSVEVGTSSEVGETI